MRAKPELELELETEPSGGNVESCAGTGMDTDPRERSYL
jgi:hypothetical protein